MPEEVYDYDLNDARREIRETRHQLDILSQRVDRYGDQLGTVERRTDLVEQDVKYIKDSIGEIKENTNWLRRTFTGVIITAVVGGFIGLFYFLAQNNLSAALPIM